MSTAIPAQYHGCYSACHFLADRTLSNDRATGMVVVRCPSVRPSVSNKCILANG